jgi:hypothetical protein
MRKFIISTLGLAIFLAPMVSRADFPVFRDKDQNAVAISPDGKDKDTVVRDRDSGVREVEYTFIEHKDVQAGTDRDNSGIRENDTVIKLVAVEKDKDRDFGIRENDTVVNVVAVAKDKDRDIIGIRESDTVIKLVAVDKDKDRDFGIRENDTVVQVVAVVKDKDRDIIGIRDNADKDTIVAEFRD